MARTSLLYALIAALGLSWGLLWGAWQVGHEKDRGHVAWVSEANLRNDVCEGALRLLNESKWTAYEKKVEELRKQRNKEDGRK